MGLVAVVTPGTVMAPTGQKLTPALVNLAANPAVTVTGNLADLGNVNPAAPADKQVLKWNAGTSKWEAGEPRVMTGATAAAVGVAGTAPSPAAGEQLKFLRGDGTWQNPSNSPSSDLFAAQQYL